MPLRLATDGIPSFTRGAGANLRHIQPIAMEDRDVAASYRIRVFDSVEMDSAVNLDCLVWFVMIRGRSRHGTGYGTSERF